MYLFPGPKVGEGSEKGENNCEVSNPSGGGIDYVDSSDLGSYGSDSDGEVVNRRSRHLCFDPNNLIPHLKLGMLLRGSKEFKIALAKYAVKKRFDIVYLKNAKGRIRAKEDGCLFETYAAVDNGDGFYKIKTFTKPYKCSTTFKKKRAFYKFVREHFLCKIRVILKLKLTEMQKLVKKELKVNLTRGKL
ncbi:hypothetical protein J1N35_039890 [Gossypium stocksii]|uniref:Transposase MuDR plant domain-containing protein n=1 Tax=Gossypium stocksii TaxID=47602 RepID=A0A9D3UCM7_9ROSI|nr:hypothetical protein J1N35_039890 [Gossypium stocksii]